MCLEECRKSQNKERLGQERSLEARRSVSGSWWLRGWKFPAPGFKAYLFIGQKAAARHGRFIMWHSSLDLCGTNRPKPTVLSVTQCFCTGLQDPSHHNDKWGRIETQGGAGDAGPWGKKKVGRTPDPPKGSKAAQPSHRPKDLEKSPPYQNYSAGQTRPARSQLGISVPTPRNSPY